MQYKTEYRVMELPDGYNNYLNTPGNVIDFLKDRFTPVREEMHLICLNIKNRVIEHHVIAIGGYNTLMCTPRDIFTPVLQANCNSFILAHNHPSDDCTPSEEDIIFTKKIEKAAGIMGMTFTDHIIFGSDDTYSFRKNGHL